MTVLLEIVDDDRLARLNDHEKPPRRGWALRKSGLYKDGALHGVLTATRANAAKCYVMKPNSTDLYVELRYRPVADVLAEDAA